MQIGDREQALFRPIECAIRIRGERDAGDGDNMVRSPREAGTQASVWIPASRE